MHFEQTSQISQPPNIHILSPFLPPLLLTLHSAQLPQMLPSKLSNVHTVPLEQHHATEQVKIQPKGRAAQSTPRLPFPVCDAEPEQVKAPPF